MKTKLGLVLLVMAGIAFAAANVANYSDQGGSDMHIGGTLQIESGGYIDVESGASLKIAGTTMSATATELNLLSSADRAVKVEKQALAAVSSGGGVLSWANPTGGTIVITRLVFDLTTAATGAGTVDCGVAAGATTSNDTLIDGLDVNAATGTFDNVENQGTNGVGVKKMTSSQFLTCSKATGDSAGLAGNAYIHYYAE